MTQNITWPRTPDEMLRLATTLAELVGGRQDVAARFFDFQGDEGKRVKCWGPWKGRRVAKDYKPLPGETVQGYLDRKTKAIEFRLLEPLSPKNITEHLRGRERLGVYVLDVQARCKFLAADFDDHSGALDPTAVWAEVRRFVEVCETNDWIVHVERSKSGTGYHVWMFFDAPVPAAQARAIGKWLFEESQLLREGENFGTFDRFFPAQSQLPPSGKGFGNLIGLPLCGAKDYAAGKTAWVDDEGDVIADAATYTLGILERGRNAAAKLPAFMQEWSLEADSGGVYEGPARDPNAKLGTDAEFRIALQRCKFLGWASEPNNQKDVREPAWFAMVSNACRFDVDDWIHDASRQHPGYSALETDLKIEHARGSSGPIGCSKIRDYGFLHCPKTGCKLPNGKAAAAPAALAVWANAGQDEVKPKRRDRSVRVTDPGATQAPAPAPAATESAPPPMVVPPDAPWRSETPVYPDTGMPWPNIFGGLSVDADGVKDHQNQYIVLRPLWVDACTRNNLGQWGVSIKFFDLDWKLRTYAFPRERLHEQGGVLGRELAMQGLPVVPGKEKWVSRYLVLQERPTLRRIRAATRLGWFDAPESPAVFVMPELVLGKAPEEIVYQPDVAANTADTLHGTGSLREWQKQVADPCTGNPVLMFSAMVGLAGPLLKLCQEQSGGFHLYGVTTSAKTTAAQVAASCWGCAADPQEGPEVTSIRKWYTTGNALESIAEVHNDMLLTLDEISEVDPHELGRIIYQLAGGLSKGRANAGGGLRAMRTWRLLFFSTGEKSVRQMLGQAGQEQKGGQRVRLPDIPADNTEDGGRAIVMDPHGLDPKDFVQNLKAGCARAYGLAGPTFAGYLIAQAERAGMSVLAGELREELRALEAKLTEDVLHALPPEGRRVIRRFAIVALAGARASMAKVLTWNLAQVVAAVRHVRDLWLNEQGQERSELDRGLSHLRDQLIRNADRFRPIDGGSRAPMRDLVGFRSPEHYLVTEHGMRELCGEFDMRTILRSLKVQGFLWHDKDRLTRKSPRIEGYSNIRLNLYWVGVDFLGEKAEGETPEDWAVQKGARRVSGETPEPQRPLLEDGDDIPF